MQIDLIETLRLRGERVQEAHWQHWLEIGSNPQVMAKMGGTWNEQKAQQKMQRNCEHWQLYGHGQWLFFNRDNEFIGRGGIRKVNLNGSNEVELGYALMPSFWGQELAVEIGHKSLSIAFNLFNYSSVVCYALADNQRSQRVMQKIGFLWESNILLAKQPHVLSRYLNPSRIT